MLKVFCRCIYEEIQVRNKKKIFKKFNIIRSKKDIILLLLETIKQLYLHKEQISNFDDFDVVKNEDDLKIVLYIDKMKRIFFCTENKIQSFCFPFNVIYKPNKLEFYYRENKLDYECISALSSVFEKSSMENSVTLVDILLDNDCYKHAGKKLQNVLEELVLFLSVFEDGYLRFDFCDEKNYNEVSHPLHHIDFYYSNSNTFKIGLPNEMSMKKNIEIIDIKQKCFSIV